MTPDVRPIERTGKASQVLQELILVLREHAVLTLVVALHVLTAFVAAAIYGVPFEPALFSFLLSVLVRFFPLYLLFQAIRQLLLMVFIEKPDSPLGLMTRRTVNALLDYRQVFRGVLAISLFGLFTACFSYFKVLIPEINPFSWDPLFATVDRILHFGRDPYEWLMPVLGFPLATFLINFFYNVWLFLMYLVVLLACFSRFDPHSRMTFLVAFVLTWAIGGNLLAIVFSSGGPVFYELLGYGEDFVPLMTALQQFDEVYPVWALGMQAILWDGYIGEGPAMGISAMPSMHLASSTLLALYGFRHARWLGYLLGGFTFVILLGSVHLGWHYAIDSYAGILIAILCWKAAAVLVRMNMRWMESRQRQL